MQLLVNKGVKVIDIYSTEDLAQYGAETLSKTFEWCKHFGEGCMSVNDDLG